MVALTKGGKTTIAMAMCHEKYRGQMVQLGNSRTEITVDWTYSPETTHIALTQILLNYQGVFGTEIRENIRCERFNEILDSVEGKYLNTTFGLEKQTDLSARDLELYVENKIKEYVNNCTDKSLGELIKNRKSNKFIRRIKVLVPPVDSFKNYFNDNDICFVLRDTRGILDMNPEEATKIQNWTMQELGLDGINAVLLLGTSLPFPDTAKWYKNVYQSAFESVPVFIMARNDSIYDLYDILYGVDDTNVNIENVRDFLENVKKGTGRGFRNFSSAFGPCYWLLDAFDIGTVSGNDFRYKYKVYNNEDLRYVYPCSDTLLHAETSMPEYCSADYKLYELMIFENLKDILSKTLEHEQFREAVLNNGQVNADFIATVTNDMSVNMYPDYRNYSRSNVCQNIINNENILGPRDGIVTTEHGNVKYLGAVTSGVSARIWLRNKVFSYEYKGVLKKEDGTDLILNMPKECQNNLIRMFLLKRIEDNTDWQAYFQGYYFMNRYKVRDAIKNVRASQSNLDPLDEATKELTNIVFR